MRNKWGIIVLCLWLTSTGLAQVNFEPVYFNITTEQGLPSMETYSVMQDSKGFIWICTDAGVCRYDGYEFKVFTTKDGLEDNIVFDIYEDYRGRIWFGGYSASLCYYENGKIHAYKYNHLLAPFEGDQLKPQKHFYFEQNGTLIYSMLGVGIIKISDEGKLVKEQGAPDKLKLDLSGKIPLIGYVRPKNGIAYRQRLDLEYECGQIKVKVKDLSRGFRFSYGKTSEGSGLILLDNHLLDTKHGLTLLKSEAADVYMVDFTYHNGRVWLSTLEGIYCYVYDRKNGKLIYETSYFNNKAISSILFDNQGGIWITTLKEGVLYLKDFGLQKAGEGMFFQNVSEIIDFRGDVYVASIEGIQNISRKNDPNEDFLLRQKSARIATDGENLFVSSTSLIKPASMRFGDHLYGTDWLSQLKVINGMFYGSSVDFSSFDVKNEKREFLYAPDKNQSGEYIGKISAFTGYGDKFFMGATNGVFELKNGRIIQIDLGKYNVRSVRVMEYDPEIGLLVGTMNDGMLILKNKKITQYSESNGMFSNKINALLVLDGEVILVGTSSGLNLLNRNSNELFKFGQDDCFGKMDINSFLIKDSLIYIGAESGLYRIPITSLKRKFRKVSFPVKAFMSGLYVDGVVQNPSKIILFPHDAYMLKVDFSVLQLNNWFSKRYQYRIGKNGNWIDLTSPSINIYKPSGEFDLEIRYMDADFRWSDPVFLCHVYVLVPFWQRWYFWSVLTLLFLGVLFLLYRRRQLQINARLVQENQVLMLEQQMQNARMNPHFIFNVLNSIHSFVIHEERDQAELYLMKFSRLMREILTQTRDGVSTIGEECSLLEKYLELEQLRHRNSFEYLVQAPLELKKRVIPSMLIQPFAENAVLHGLKGRKGGVLRITFRKESEQEVEVTISDNGRMSDEQFEKLQQSGDKNAFGITKLRLEKYNRLKQTKNYGITILRSEEGTVIRITIPILEDQHEK